MCLAAFQLTAPHGGRRMYLGKYELYETFQLTAPHGGRQGGRHSSKSLGMLSGVFQLTAPHGGRQISSVGWCRHWHFNSRPHTGADSPASSNTCFNKSFQLTAPHGGRLDFHCLVVCCNYFNSRPHTGADSKIPYSPIEFYFYL